MSNQQLSQVTKHKSSPRLSHLDGVRAIAALYVVFSHGLLQVKRTDLSGKAHYFWDLFSFGHSAVDIFIVLSGFCLMLPVLHNQIILRNGIGDFFRRRAKRLLPPYFFALALSLLCVFFLEQSGSHWPNDPIVTPSGILTHIFLVHDLFSGLNAQINPVFWSLGVEWRIYFIFPLLVFLWKYLGALRTTLLSVLFGYLLLFALRGTFINTQPNGATPEYLGLFALGMIAADVSYRLQKQTTPLNHFPKWLSPRIGVLFFSVIIIVDALSSFLNHNWHGMPLVLNELLVGLWISFILVYVSQPDGSQLKRILSWRPLVFIGTFAYSLYLTHYPVLQILRMYVSGQIGWKGDTMLAAQWVIGVPLSVAFAYLFHLAFERPFMSKPAPKTEQEAEAAATVSPAP